MNTTLNKKVIVTGATGQDGSYMCEYLLEKGYSVIGTFRRTSQPILSNLTNCINQNNFKFVPLDLNDVHSITSLIKTEQPDYFINFGASAFVPDSWNSPASVMQVNAVSLIHILEAVRNYSPSCRVYSAGSSEQWGDVVESPQNEKTQMRPRSIYGVSKCAASMICKVYRESYKLYVIHGILFNHESERRQEYYVTRKVTKGLARIFNSIKNGQAFEPIRLGNIYAKRDWSHAADFVDGIWRMLNQDAYRLDLRCKSDCSCFPSEIPKYLKEYVLASGETHTIKEFIDLAVSYAGLDGVWTGDSVNEKMVIPDYLQDMSHVKSKILIEIDPKFYRPAEVDILLGDSTLAREELEWKRKISFDRLVKLMVSSDIHEQNSK